MVDALRCTKPHKQLEKLSDKECKLVEGILACDAISGGWLQALAELADDRLALASVHLSAAASLERECAGDPSNQVLRSAISRAYFSMFCAVRSALSLQRKGDVNDHTKIADALDGATSLGPDTDREFVVTAMGKFRRMRNEADYSPYYVGPMAIHAREAIEAANEVLRICRRWVEQTKKSRGLQ